MRFGRKPKYGASIVKDFATGRKMYDSKLESDYAQVLALREKAEEIRNIEEQVTVHLHGRIRWKIDFVFDELRNVIVGDRTIRRWVPVWVDTKGFETVDFRIKKELWSFHGPGELWIVKRKSKNAHFVRSEIVAVKYPWPSAPWPYTGQKPKARKLGRKKRNR